MSGQPTTGRGYRAGDAGYRRITSALFAAGLATFASMYSVQAVLPDIAHAFDTSPAGAALTVSATTGALAISIVPASILSERFGRIRVMAWAAGLSALIGVLIPVLPNLGLIVAFRALQGLTLAGVPAVAMAYLAEEVHTESLGAAMGRYIAGTTIGGLAGRLIASSSLSLVPWRTALEVACVFALVLTVFFIRLAPPSRHFAPQDIRLRASLRHLADHLHDARIVALVGVAFLLMGSFVSIYNVLGFRLLAHPFDLSPQLAGLVFVLYLSGTVSSAWAGRLSDRFGRARVLFASTLTMLAGLSITLPNNLALVLVGILLFTGGFFAAHACASSAVSAMATQHRAEASSLYLFGYYTGSSVVGALTGIPYARAGWTGCVVFVAGLICVALALMTLVARRVGPSR